MITITKTPQTISPAFNPVVIGVVSDEQARTDFKYNVLIKDFLGNVIAQKKLIGNSDISYVTGIDVSKTISLEQSKLLFSYWRYAPLLSEYIYYIDTFKQGYSVEVSEYYDGGLQDIKTVDNVYTIPAGFSSIRNSFYDYDTIKNAGYWLTNFEGFKVRPLDKITNSYFCPVGGVSSFQYDFFDINGELLQSVTMTNPQSSISEDAIHLHNGLSEVMAFTGIDQSTFDNTARYEITPMLSGAPPVVTTYPVYRDRAGLLPYGGTVTKVLDRDNNDYVLLYFTSTYTTEADFAAQMKGALHASANIDYNYIDNGNGTISNAYFINRGTTDRHLTFIDWDGITQDLDLDFLAATTATTQVVIPFDSATMSFNPSNFNFAFLNLSTPLANMVKNVSGYTFLTLKVNIDGVDTNYSFQSSNDLSYFSGGLPGTVFTPIEITYTPKSIAPAKPLPFTVMNEGCRFPGVRVHFLNEWGAVDSFVFSLADRRGLSITKKKAKLESAIGSDLRPLNFKRGNTPYIVKYTDTLKLTSDYINDNDSNALLEMFTSPIVSVETEMSLFLPAPKGMKIVLPCELDIDSYDIKKSSTDKLHNLELEVKVSVDNTRQTL